MNIRGFIEWLFPKKATATTPTEFEQLARQICDLQIAGKPVPDELVALFQLHEDINEQMVKRDANPPHSKKHADAIAELQKLRTKQLIIENSLDPEKLGKPLCIQLGLAL